MDFALAVYPLTSAYQKKFEETIGGAPHYLTLSELRRMSLPVLARTLRTLHADHFYLLLEDAGSRAILPVAEAVAAFSDARVIKVVNPDFTRTKVSRWRVAWQMFSFLAASFMLQTTSWAAQLELRLLLKESRITPKAINSERFLYLNTNLWFGVKAGGSVGHIAGVINALVELGYRGDYASVDKGVMLSPSIDTIPLESPNCFGLPFELNYYRLHNMAVRRLQGMNPCRFIYQRMSVGNYTGVMLSRMRGVPLILEYNGSEAWIAKNWGRPMRYHELAVQAEDVCLKHAHLIVTVSEVLQDELVARGVEENRILYYPNCVNPEVFNPGRFTEAECMMLRERYGIKRNAIVITFIGTFGRWHGVGILAEAIASLTREDSDWLKARGVHFLLIGDGLQMPEVKSILSDDRCKPFYTLAGLVPQDEAPLHLAASDIFVSPHVVNEDGSRFFGSPTKLFEYMAMGGAIIASDLEQIGAIMENSLNVRNLPGPAETPCGSYLGVLAQPGSVDDLSAGIRFLADRADWRAHLGIEARKEVISKYTWKQHAAAILRKFDDSI